MSEPLLQTKIFIPALRSNLVHRSRLAERLNQGLQQGSKLTLVTAPAGFGKTTFVSSWVQHQAQSVAWLSLDEGDNSPNRLVFYMIAALQTIDLALGKSATSLLQSPGPPPPDTLLTLLINDLAALPKQVILVLDDYHVIHNLEIHQALTFLLDNQPPQLHLIIVSREDPALPLHRLRASGQVTGVYVRDLRFTAEEVAQFISETMGINLVPEDVAVLERRTEGWVAGLQLAALSIQDAQDPREFLAVFAGDDRYISDYLINEVFERQPTQIQEFLLKTAILDRFSVPLCEAILGTGERRLGIGDSGQMQSSRAIIDRLDQSNLFITPLDNKRKWYCYHHLFADFLRARMRDRPADEIADLHHRAAAWYEDNGQLAEAIEHALVGEDFQRAARLIEKNALTTIFGLTQWATLFGWMATLPDELVRSRPQLSLNFAWALFTTGRWEDAESYLQGVEMAIGEGKETTETSWMLGEVATIRALVAYERGNMKRCGDLSHQALKLLPDDNLTIRSVAILAKGMAHLWGGDVQITRQILQEAADIAQAADNLTVALFAIGYRMQLEVREGQLQKAAELYQQARLLGTLKGGILLGPVGFAYVQMGEVLREWNQLEQAKQTLLEGVKLCQQQTGMPEYVLEGQINLARTMLANGNKRHAAETMQQTETLIADMQGRGGNVLPIISMALAYRLRFWLAQGSLDIANRWLASNEISVDEDIAPGGETEHLLLARVLIAGERFGEAILLLKRILPLVEYGEGPRSIIEVLVLMSIAAQAHGEQELALRSIQQALLLAEPEGYLRIFMDEGESLTDLLSDAMRSGEKENYVRTIQAAIQDERQRSIERKLRGVGRQMTATQPTTKPGLLEPLTEQEQRILKLIAAGLSNREIAAELFLSVNTIKTYTSRIYGKLGVHRRAKAVDRAHEIGLL